MGWRGTLTQTTPLWQGIYLRSVSTLTGLRGWDRVGISTLGDVMRGTTMKSFQQLQTDFCLHKSQFYKFLQLRHALQPHIHTLESLPEFQSLEGRLLTGDLGPQDQTGLSDTDDPYTHHTGQVKACVASRYT